MPLLDFQCGKCGNKFDELVYTSQMDKVTCPECGSRDVKRVYEENVILACWAAVRFRRVFRRSCSGCSGCGH